MITEATLIISRWLKDETNGVNAMLDKVPLNKIGGGTYTAPKDVTIYDDCSDDCVGEELEPDIVPALVVFADSEITFDMDAMTPEKPNGEPAKAQKATGLIMAVTYIVRDVPPIKARRDGGFVLRATKMSLNRFNSGRFRGTNGNLNSVFVRRISDLRMQRVAGSVGRSTLAGFILATLMVEDRLP